MSNVWLIENQKSTNKQKPKPANKTKTQTKKNKQTKRNKFKLLLQQQYSVPLRMSVHRQWANWMSLNLIARNPISTNRGFTAYKPCTNLDLRKSRQEQLRCERRRRTGNISEKYFVQQMKQNISAHRLNHSKPCPAIGPKNSRLPLDQSAVHWKLIMVWSPTFSRAFSSLPVFNLSSHENTHSVHYLLAIVVILVSVFRYIFSL